MDETPLLAVRELRKTFGSTAAPVRALRGVDLTVARGEFVALIGPSGSGKSTLLQLIAGLDTADGGEVAIDGERMTGLGEDARGRLRRRQIGYVFQFFNLLERMTALENVVLAALIGEVPRRQAEDRGRELLDLLGLSDKADVPPPLLSGGLRQRLAIARALATDPPLLLADEPTGALDSDGGAEILELFRRLNVRGRTILVVTHDAGVAAAAGRIVAMRDGRLEQPAVGAAAG
jgi:putative ABC transport system ATP-binding protein